MGFIPFGVIPPDRYPDVSASDGPTYRFTHRCSLRPKALGRPGGPRFLGFYPAASSDRLLMGLAPQPTVTPVGFALPGYFVRTLTGISPDLLSRALFDHDRERPAEPAPQSLDQFSLRSSDKHGAPRRGDEQPS
jgi:hypothetical protein